MYFVWLFLLLRFLCISGRSYSVTSHKLLPLCIESIVQKIQQSGVLVRFEKVGPDPLPVVNGTILIFFYGFSSDQASFNSKFVF